MELDLIRGAALLGIIIANMPLFSYPYLYLNIWDGTWWTGTADRIVTQLTHIVVEYKFITMFSFLFGAGFMIFLERAEQKGRLGATLYVRRLSILLAIGILHGYLVWFGDILAVYAMLGFILLAFRKSKPNTLLYWALGLLLIPALWIAVHTFAPWLMPWGLPPGPTPDAAERFIRDSVEAYGSGSYADIFRQRLTDLGNLQNGSLLTAPMTLAMFLLGAFAWRKDWLRNPMLHAALIRSVWLWSGAVGLIFQAIQVWLYQTVDAGREGYNHAQWAAVIVAGPALCLFYVTSLLLLMRKRFWRKLLAPLQDAGRMALTNYLLQSVGCTLLFYSYGLGWYGQVSPLYGLLLAVAIFGMQVWVSSLWMRRYRFGPVEWLWRCLTYGERQPMKRGG